MHQLLTIASAVIERLDCYSFGNSSFSYTWGKSWTFQ